MQTRLDLISEICLPPPLEQLELKARATTLGLAKYFNKLKAKQQPLKCTASYLIIVIFTGNESKNSTAKTVKTHTGSEKALNV